MFSNNEHDQLGKNDWIHSSIVYSLPGLIAFLSFFFFFGWLTWDYSVWHDWPCFNAIYPSIYLYITHLDASYPWEVCQAAVGLCSSKMTSNELNHWTGSDIRCHFFVNLYENWPGYVWKIMPKGLLNDIS